MRRGQSSLEFILLASAMLLGVTLVIVVAQGMLAQVQEDRHQSSLRAIENAVVREIEHAALTSDGYERTFSLPSTIDGAEYNIIIWEEAHPARDVIIFTWRGTTRLHFSANNITGTIGAGRNTIERTPGAIVITNG